MRFVAVVSALIVFVFRGGIDVAAQKVSDRALRRVDVQLDGGARNIEARLVGISPQTVTLLVSDREITLPSNRVTRITARRWDSPLDGALIGAAAGGLICTLVCGQGLERRGHLLGAAGRSAVTVGAIGAGLDLLTFEREIIHAKP